MSEPVTSDLLKFLVQSDVNAPAKISEESKWQQILPTEKFTKADVEPQGSSKDGDVTITLVGPDSWDLQFSSVSNETYFGQEPASDELRNRAWIGDELNSAVLALSSTQTSSDIFTRNIPLTRGAGSAFKALGIPSGNKTANIQWNDFVTAVDPVLNIPGVPDAPLTAKLQNPALTAPNNPNPSAFWCTTTSLGYSTTIRLEFAISIPQAIEASPMGRAITWANETLSLGISISDIKAFFGSSPIPDLQVTCTKSTTYDPETLTPVEGWTVSFQFHISNFKFALDFSDTNNVFYLIPTSGSGDIVQSLKNAVGNVDGLDRNETPSADAQSAKLFGDHLDIWYVKLQKDFSTSPSPLKWAVGLLAGWTYGDDNDPILSVMTYESANKRFHGKLVLQTDPLFTHVRYSDYDYRLALDGTLLLRSQNIDISKISSDISLWKLFKKDSTPPPKELTKIPFNIAGADIVYQTLNEEDGKTGTNVTFTLDVAAHAAAEAFADDEAPSGFTWDKLSVMVSRTSKKDKAPGSKAEKEIAIEIFSNVSLIPVHDTTLASATLAVTLSYDKKSTSEGVESDWTLHGTLADLKVALLADIFFNESCSSGAMEVLGQLTLSELDVLYTYNSGKASSFLISAVITLGGLELDLSYQYISKAHKPNKPTATRLQWGSKPPYAELSQLAPDPDKDKPKTSWAFEAFLKVKEQSSTVAAIANSIVPGKGDDLPDFVGSIEVVAKGDASNAPIKLIYKGDDLNGSILALWVNIGPFNMTFIQYRPKTEPVTQTGPQNPATKISRVKQILRISCDQIPMLDKVPLVNQLPQPFDHLIYLWVGDNDPKQPNKNLKGFTREMIDKDIGKEKSINQALADIGIPEIQLKSSKRPLDADLVLAAGHHFVIVANDKVVLDHIFEPGANPTATPKPKSPPANAPPVAPDAPVQPPPPPPTRVVTRTENPPTKGDANTKAGPLTVSALTVQYKNGSLFLGVDATLVLGPLTFSVIGFTLEIEISKVKLNNLAALITDELMKVSIHGLEAGVSKEPLTLKGVFIHDIVGDDSGDVTTESYRGGIAVGFKAWKVLAVGEYAIVSTKSTNSEFKSVFVYGKLDGPLVTLEFATISGVRLGFGYNSLVHLPTAENLYQFPFISDTAGGDDPLQVLNAMEGGSPPFVYKKLGGVWFAAGMTITCFDCISLTAVLMFEIETKSDQNGVIIALLADGVFQMPPLAPPEVSLFYIELLIKVELNFIEGYIAADAALAPASHVYVPSARLTGSGSFYTWFPPSAHAGDWVVTIGGYHRAYRAPDHYPKNLKRLGLNFTVGNAVHVVGGAYVAVTPKCAMAGGSLHISVDVGPVSAYADIALDVFINFKPFYFIAEIRLSVGVDCDVDLLFVSFHISITLSADLTLWGPDSFGGTAYVDFWFFGFSIDFGAGLRDPPGIPLIEFYDIVRTAGPPSAPPEGDKTSAENPYQAQHKYSIEDGLFPEKPESSTDGEFPNTGATIEWKVLAGPLQVRIDCDFALSAAYLVTSRGDVQIDADTKLTDIYSFPMHNTKPIESKLFVSVYDLDGGEDNKQLIDDFQAELVLKNAPKATWTKYTSDMDPLARISGGKRNKPTGLQDGGDPTVELCQGVRLFPPVATLAKSKITDFDASAAMFLSENVEPIALSPPQTTLLCTPFESEKDSGTQWSDFTSMFKGATDADVPIDSSGADPTKTVTKAEIRGDGTVQDGLLGLLITTLGWDVRGAAEKEGGVVIDVKIADPADATKQVVQRKEWELVGVPPELLADELGYYYPYLPQVTTAVVTP